MSKPYNMHSSLGKEALEYLDNLKVGEVISCPLIPAIKTRAIWKLVDKKDLPGDEAWFFEGYFCTIPFQKMEVSLEGSTIITKITEV